MGTHGQKRNDPSGRPVYALGALDGAVRARLETLGKQDVLRRLWSKDPALWRDDPAHRKIISNSLGWLNIIEQQVGQIGRIQALADSVQSDGFRHVLLLGMGGSSLCPEVFRMTFGIVPGRPELHVLDSTVPAQVRSFEKRLELARTLCVVASKSGSTTEPLSFQRYFFDRMRAIKGDRAGKNFIAITDPGSLLEKMARESGYRDVLPGVPDIGGRYSALSNFGVVPAAIMGVDVEALLERAGQMRASCGAEVSPEENPGAVLGAALGELALRGRDKVTFVTSPAIEDLGAWLEQLIAESTGKEGKGIIPVDGEDLGPPEMYGDDRFFVALTMAGETDPEKEEKLAALERAGHPVVRMALQDRLDLGGMFFLWEVATAVAGSILGIDAFDQPNVQESKDYTRNFLEEFKTNGRIPEEEPILTDDGIRIHGDEANRKALQGATDLKGAMAAHFARLRPGDYAALNAYVERTESGNDILQAVRRRLRDGTRAATTLGYGPRFLHSTGQLHKGGPNSGVFLQITSDDAEDLPIPGEPYTFGVLKSAQALGDFLSLNKRDRRALRVHLGPDVVAGLRRLRRAVDEAVGSPP